MWVQPFRAPHPEGGPACAEAIEIAVRKDWMDEVVS